MKKLIERAYREGPSLSLAVWCENEAGPYQTIPQPGQSRAPVGEPSRYPQEYVPGGTAKLLTLFHPVTGRVSARGAPTPRMTHSIYSSSQLDSSDHCHPVQIR